MLSPVGGLATVHPAPVAAGHRGARAWPAGARLGPALPACAVAVSLLALAVGRSLRLGLCCRFGGQVNAADASLRRVSLRVAQLLGSCGGPGEVGGVVGGLLGTLLGGAAGVAGVIPAGRGVHLVRAGGFWRV